MITRGRTSRYAYSHPERDAIIEEFKEENPEAKVGIQRYKGLGEMNLTNCGLPQWTPQTAHCQSDCE